MSDLQRGAYPTHRLPFLPSTPEFSSQLRRQPLPSTLLFHATPPLLSMVLHSSVESAIPASQIRNQKSQIGPTEAGSVAPSFGLSNMRFLISDLRCGNR